MVVDSKALLARGGRPMNLKLLQKIQTKYKPHIKMDRHDRHNGQTDRTDIMDRQTPIDILTSIQIHLSSITSLPSILNRH